MATYTLTPAQLRGAGIYNSFEISAGGGGGGFADTTSFLLDQVDDHLLGTSNWGTISGSGEFTISLWVKFTTLSGIQKLFQCNDTGTGYVLYGYYRGDTGQIEVWSGGSGSNWTRSVAGVIVAGQWYHIVMRLSDASVSRYYRQKIFIDGAYSNGGSNYYTNSIVQGSELSVGGTPSAIQSVDGNINEFAVWGSTALTDAQILEVYNSGSANDLKTLPTAPIPTNWFRSENANWLGSYYELVDEMGSGYKFNTRNMSEASKVSDVPS